MSTPVSLDDLWNSTAINRSTFDADQLSGIPVEAQHYLRHAIATGTPLATAVRLQMHGEIKLNGWHPFTAEEVICWDRGMIWQAAVRMFGLPARGSDRLLDGQGAMQWKLFGVVPLVNV
jgi:hypothetical protein